MSPLSILSDPSQINFLTRIIVHQPTWVLILGFAALLFIYFLLLRLVRFLFGPKKRPILLRNLRRPQSSQFSGDHEVSVRVWLLRHVRPGAPLPLCVEVTNCGFKTLDQLEFFVKAPGGNQISLKRPSVLKLNQTWTLKVDLQQAKTQQVEDAGRLISWHCTNQSRLVDCEFIASELQFVHVSLGYLKKRTRRVALIGAAGSGKTTFMNHCLGLFESRPRQEIVSCFKPKLTSPLSLRIPGTAINLIEFPPYSAETKDSFQKQLANVHAIFVFRCNVHDKLNLQEECSKRGIKVHILPDFITEFRNVYKWPEDRFGLNWMIAAHLSSVL